MNERPKCPYCGDKMFLSVPPRMHDKEVLSAWYQCVTCESTSSHLEFPGSSKYDEIKKKTLDVALCRAESRNRVLTLNEVIAKIDSDEMSFTWVEFAKHTHAGLYPLNQFILEDENPKERKITLFFFGANPWMDEKEDDYGKTWRCWLKEPTKEERFATNWEEAKS